MGCGQIPSRSACRAQLPLPKNEVSSHITKLFFSWPGQQNVINMFPNYWSNEDCSLAAKIASVLGGAVISMENYYDPSITIDDSNDFETIDFKLLLRNLEV